ncbi:MAG: hypothetical protein JWN44_3447 [Myxococcales bacterium]|nr:hypothetical protein [Myxococcales bacterium]
MKLLTRFAVVIGAIIGADAAGTGAWAQSGGLSAGAATPTVEATASTKPRFYGFALDLTMADGSGLNSIGHNYRNDFVWYFEPTWNLGKMYLRGSRWQTLQLQARFSLTANVSGTDEANFSGYSNSTGPQGTCGNPSINDNGSVDPGSVAYCSPKPNNRRADYSDTFLTLRNPRIYTIPKVEVAINPSFRVVLPTSAESQYSTLIMSIQPSISIGRSFLHDKLRLGYGFGFTKYFHRYAAPQLDPTSGGQAATVGGNYNDGAFGAGLSNFYADPSRAGTIGGYNPSYSFTHTVSGGYQLSEKWSVDVIYLIVDAFTYDHSCTLQVNGVTYSTCASGDAVAANSGATVTRPGHRDSQVFWATLAYQPVDWLGLTLAWINWAPLQKPDSSYRQGLISTDYNAFTTIQLGATITVDKLAARYWRK